MRSAAFTSLEHTCRSCCWGYFPIINHFRFTVGASSHQHEPASTNIAGSRVGYCQGKRNGDSGIDSVATSPQNIGSDPASNGTNRNNSLTGKPRTICLK
jgi:hypothetical protein